MQTELERDTIVVRDIDAVYLYAQATQLTAWVRELNQETREHLTGRGFFNAIPRSMHYRPRRLWSGLMLLLGNACPMGCKYCYAHGGDDNCLMSLEIADRAVTTYLAQKPKRAKVTFFGAGEPSLNSAAIKYVVEKYGDTIKWQMTTCAVIPEDFLHWLIDHGVMMTVSVDGPPHIQDHLRPLANGAPSSSFVERTIATLVEAGRHIGVRATVTQETLTEIESILHYFDTLNATRIHLEGMYSLGRALESKDLLSPLSLEDRLAMLIQAMDWASQAPDRRIKMGGLSYILRPRIAHYCGAMQGQTMVVNYRGQLTACSEVADDRFQEWPLFHLGHIGKSGELVVNEEKLTYLRRRVTTNMDKCRTCFARYVCRGGCAHKAWAETGNLFEPGNVHCQFVQAAISILVRHMAERARFLSMSNHDEREVKVSA